MYLKIILFIPLLSLVACGAKKEGIRYGETTKAALISEEGEPQSIETPRPSVEILQYEGEQKYQVQNDLVVAGFRNPLKEEKALLYWRHKFKDCKTEFTELTETKTHLKPEKQLRCASLGINVIYDPNTDQVTRIVESAHE